VTALEPGVARIGFVGLGMMGLPMAGRLADGGYDLVVLDQRRDVAEAFATERAATAAADLAEVARSCDAVITMLPTGSVVATVVAGEGDCLLAGAGPGTVLIDMSSSEPAGTRDLGAQAAARGVTLLDAPVSGGVPKAESGELAILVGGPPEAVERCRPLLSRMGRRVFHTGDLGTGHAMKALNNLLSAVGLLATAEVLMVGTRFGLDASLMLEVLNASTGRNNSTEAKFGPYVLSGTYDSGFALDLMVKDLRTALRIAHATDTPSPLSEEVLARCAQAQEALGRGADHTAVARWVQDVAGSRYDDGRAL
jgi:3-hydroxyisobutyrate dehydrogenase